MTWGRMNDKACRFIENQQEFILIQDDKGNRFRINFHGLWTWYDQHNAITRPNLVAGFHNLTTDSNMAVLN
ncbi:MAG: hypothetical protein NPIRA06_29520 [Nitrospirales bacterium]|nr:MAG: hypothetical protein NPIRA06_29520 [Nitrospirales bacterium]